jgi:hypothetical protein
MEQVQELVELPGEPIAVVRMVGLRGHVSGLPLKPVAARALLVALDDYFVSQVELPEVLV